MSSPARVLAATVLVEAAREHEIPGRVKRREIERVLEREDYALYVFRGARSRTHPLWTGEGPDPGNPYQTGGAAWDRVQAAARLLGIPETEPTDPP